MAATSGKTEDRSNGYNSCPRLIHYFGTKLTSLFMKMPTEIIIIIIKIWPTEWFNVVVSLKGSINGRGIRYYSGHRPAHSYLLSA